MPRILGNNYIIKPGETLPFEWTVKNSLNQPATNLGVAAFWLIQGTTRTKYAPAINGDVLTQTLSDAITRGMSGIYRYECRVKDLDSDVDHLKEGIIEVETDAVINEALVIPD